MTVEEKGYSVLSPNEQYWRESNIMKIPNTNLTEGLGVSERIGGRLWRVPPYSANTWHKHVDSWEFYFVLEGDGRMRVGKDTVRLPRYGCAVVAPHMLRQVFNDTAQEVLWLIVGAPQEGHTGRERRPGEGYPEDPTSLPEQLSGRSWPPS